MRLIHAHGPVAFGRDDSCFSKHSRPFNSLSIADAFSPGALTHKESHRRILKKQWESVRTSGERCFLGRRCAAINRNGCLCRRCLPKSERWVHICIAAFVAGTLEVHFKFRLSMPQRCLKSYITCTMYYEQYKTLHKANKKSIVQQRRM